MARSKKEAQPVLDAYSQYFDDVILELAPMCKDFAAVRNKMANQVKTDYYFWIDTDDTIDQPEKIKELTKICDVHGLDAIMLPYEYHRNEFGEVAALQWRERILRTAYPWKWHGVVHETPVHNGDAKISRSEDVMIRHKVKTQDELMNSAMRNHRLLKGAVNSGDPRVLYYLGNSYFYMNDHKQAIKLLNQYIEKSGWDEEKYRALLSIIKAHIALGQHDLAVDTGLRAIKMFPQFPYAYLEIGRALHAQGEYPKSNEWIKIGLSKPIPDEMMMHSPAEIINGMTVSIVNYNKLGLHKEALDMLNIALTQSPNNVGLLQLKPGIEYTYHEQNILNSTRAIGGLRWQLS